MIEKTASALANPTKAGLVYAPAAWPGVITDLDDLGRERGPTYRRPEVCFAVDGPLPDEARLVSYTPEGWETDAFRAQVEAELEDKLAEHRATIKASGRGWVGAPAVLARSPLSSPGHTFAVNAGRAAQVRPRLFGGTKEETKAMIMRRKSFLERYAIALGAWRDGIHEALFPEGTCRLWRCFGARRGAPGTPGERCHFGPTWLRGPDALAPS